ncbi:hypothetical protein ACJJTC_019769 [Scirpophaga incertulas]
MNILRALFRNSALEEIFGILEEGLIVALTGFEGDTWMGNPELCYPGGALRGPPSGPPVALAPCDWGKSYLTHIESMFTAIHDQKIKRNQCHGVLLQLTKLLDRKPAGLVVSPDFIARISQSVRDTTWILEQGVDKIPCYVILDEYVKMINVALWRFPSLFDQDMLDTILKHSQRVLFTKTTPLIALGREICLANVMYLCINILQQNQLADEIAKLVLKALEHPMYEVVLSSMNYILILHEELEIDNKFLKYLSVNRNGEVLSNLRNDKEFIRKLSVIATSNYLECAQKSLTILSLEDGTQRNIIEAKLALKSEALSDEDIIKGMFHCIRTEHENVTHIYLRSLSKFVSAKLVGGSLDGTLALEVAREVYSCSSSDNSEETRREVVVFLESNLGILMGTKWESLTDKERSTKTLIVS